MTNPVEFSERSSETSSDSSMPQYEPWLGMTAASLIPMVAMFLLPQAFMWPMIAASALILAAGMFMLLRQERGKKDVRGDA